MTTADRKMEFQEVIRNNKGSRFYITTTDGKHLQARLFISPAGHICQYKQHSKKLGTVLDISCIRKIDPVKKEVNDFKQFHKNVSLAARLLKKSGLWPDIQKQMESMSKLTEKDFQEVTCLWQHYMDYEYSGPNPDKENKARWDNYINYFTERGLTPPTDITSFRMLKNQRLIITLPFGSLDNIYETDREKMKTERQQRVSDLLETVKEHDGKNFKEESVTWTGTCQYTASVAKQDGVVKGWFFIKKKRGGEEDYLLLDETHAIFVEY